MAESNSRRYRTIYADPPWPERGAGKIKRGADRHYDLMSIEEIKALPVSEIAEDNAHLYLWVTNNFMRVGLEVMEAWGFQYKTIITWGKDRMGLGQYFRGMTEHCLFGVRGCLPYRIDGSGGRLQGSTLVLAPRTIHSRKPAQIRQMIERVSYSPYIELFARGIPAEGWYTWGNQAKAGAQFEDATFCPIPRRDEPEAPTLFDLMEAAQLGETVGSGCEL